MADRLATEFGLPAGEPGFASNAERVRNRDAVVAAIDAAFAEHPLAELLPRLAASGCRPARCAPWTASTTGTRPDRRACSSRSSTPPPAG